MSKRKPAAAENIDELTRARNAAVQELAEDARRYLELVRVVTDAPGGSDARVNAEAELEVQVAVLRAHATTLCDLIDEVDDALGNPVHTDSDPKVSRTP